MTKRILRWMLALLLCSLSWAAGADVFRPAYLELRERGEGRYDVLWKVPAQGSARLAVQVVWPADTTQLSPPQALLTDGAFVERWRIQRHGGLIGQTLRIEGLSGGVTDVVVRVERADGTAQVERLLPQDPSFTVKGPTGPGEVAWSYLVLGVQHILGGIDHLLFVLALLLIVHGGRRIFFTITAFTLAHSLTLMAATLGRVHVPGPPVEAAIALSIVFVAAEVVHGLRGRPALTARAPWVVAFGFGLLHGFGFAGALAEVGLPQAAIPLALLMFNVGVEVGQLIFVVAVLLLRRLFEVAIARRPDWVAYLPPYAIGTMAMFWVIERVSAFWA